MAHATTDDGVKLYFEESGSGRPLIFRGPPAAP